MLRLSLSDLVLLRKSCRVGNPDKIKATCPLLERGRHGGHTERHTSAPVPLQHCPPPLPGPVAPLSLNSETAWRPHRTVLSTRQSRNASSCPTWRMETLFQCHVALTQRRLLWPPCLTRRGDWGAPVPFRSGDRNSESGSRASADRRRSRRRKAEENE